MTIHVADRRAVIDVISGLVRHPYTRLLRRWNWKAAATSAVTRGVLFFAANLSGGLAAARAAFITELVLRGITSGFYGTVTQAFCRVEPRWAATLTASILMPVISHAIELAVHWLRGTEQLAVSIAASAILTVASTAFNLHVMRHGVLTAGEGAQPLWSDLRAIPGLVLSFVGVRAGGVPPRVDSPT